MFRNNFGSGWKSKQHGCAARASSLPNVSKIHGVSRTARHRVVYDNEPRRQIDTCRYVHCCEYSTTQISPYKAHGHIHVYITWIGMLHWKGCISLEFRDIGMEHTNVWYLRSYQPRRLLEPARYT